MKKIILSLVVLCGFATSAFATSQEEVLVCSFTEPFFTIVYNADTNLVTYTGVDMYDELNEDFMVLTLATQARFEAVPSVDTEGNEYIYPTQGSEFRLLDDKGDVIVTLTLSYQGSDGMSDFLYPFDAIHSSGHVGGCYSTSAPLIDPLDIYEQLSK